MVKVMYNDKIVYNVIICVFVLVTLLKEKEYSLIITMTPHVVFPG